MTDRRAAVRRGQIAAHTAAQNRRVPVADSYAAAVSSARLSGAWVTASRGSGPDFVMGVAGLATERLAELQLTLGERGPQPPLTPSQPEWSCHLTKGDPDGH